MWIGISFPSLVEMHQPGAQRQAKFDDATVNDFSFPDNLPFIIRHNFRSFHALKMYSSPDGEPHFEAIMEKVVWSRLPFSREMISGRHWREENVRKSPLRIRVLEC